MGTYADEILASVRADVARMMAELQQGRPSPRMFAGSETNAGGSPPQRSTCGSCGPQGIAPQDSPSPPMVPRPVEFPIVHRIPRPMADRSSSPGNGESNPVFWLEKIFREENPSEGTPRDPGSDDPNYQVAPFDLGGNPPGTGLLPADLPKQTPALIDPSTVTTTQIPGAAQPRVLPSGILLGGIFNAVDTIRVKDITSFENGRWKSYVGLQDEERFGIVYFTDAALFNGTLYACGEFHVNDRIYTLVKWVEAEPRGQWEPVAGTRFGQMGEAQATALAVFDGALYMAVTVALGRALVLRLSGETWGAAGDGGPLSRVNCLYVWNGSLYAGGASAGSGSNVAKWDGNEWSGLGGGLPQFESAPSEVHSLEAHPDGATEYLYAGGRFAELGGVARWTGLQWERVGDGLNANSASASVRALKSHLGRDGVRRLYAGGMNLKGGPRLYRWDPAADSWITVGEAFKKFEATPVSIQTVSIESLSEYKGDLIVAGAFNQRIRPIGGVAATRTAWWNPEGTLPGAPLGSPTTGAWDGLNGGPDGPVHALAEFPNALLVGGSFGSVRQGESSILCNNIALYDGTWHTWFRGLNGTVRAIEIAGEYIFVGGDFTDAGGEPASSYIATIGSVPGGAGWVRMSTLDGPVHAIKAYGLDQGSSGGRVYVGGAFRGCRTSDGNYAPSPGIAIWQGSHGTQGVWEPFDGGVWREENGGFVAGVVNAIAIHQSPDGDYLYIGGSFTHVGSSPRIAAMNIARRRLTDDGEWESLSAAEARGGGVAGEVKALAVFGLEADTVQIYAGGTFQEFVDRPAIGSLPGLSGDCPYVARWNPATRFWSNLGTTSGGTGGPSSGSAQTGVQTGGTAVHAMYVFGDILHLTGLSRTGQVSAIRRFDGDRWMPNLGDHSGEAGLPRELQRAADLMGGPIYAITSAAVGRPSASLYIGGDFTKAGMDQVIDEPTMSIAAFNEVDGYKPFAGGIGSRIFRSDARQDSGAIQRVRVFGEGQAAVLFAVGPFDSASHLYAEYVAAYDQDGWRAFAEGLRGNTNGSTNMSWIPGVYALAASGGKIYVGGNFKYAVNPPAEQPAGGDPTQPPGDQPLQELVEVNNVVEWDGVTRRWNAMADGPDKSGLPKMLVRAVEVHGPDRDLYVGGSGGAEDDGVLIWRPDPASPANSQWEQVGAGQLRNATTNALKSFGGALFAGGRFDFQRDRNLITAARLSGESWSDANVRGMIRVNAFAVAGAGESARLFCGGHAMENLTVTVGVQDWQYNPVREWTVDGWRTVGNNLYGGDCRTLTFLPAPELRNPLGGLLIAAGHLWVHEGTGSATNYRVAHFDGNRWTGLANPPTAPAASVAARVGAADEYFFGGEFNEIGTRDDFNNIADWRYRQPPTPLTKESGVNGLVSAVGTDTLYKHRLEWQFEYYVNFNLLQPLNTAEPVIVCTGIDTIVYLHIDPEVGTFAQEEFTANLPFVTVYRTFVSAGGHRAAAAVRSGPAGFGSTHLRSPMVIRAGRRIGRIEIKISAALPEDCCCEHLPVELLVDTDYIDRNGLQLPCTEGNQSFDCKNITNLETWLQYTQGETDRYIYSCGCGFLDASHVRGYLQSYHTILRLLSNPNNWSSSTYAGDNREFCNLHLSYPQQSPTIPHPPMGGFGSYLVIKNAGHTLSELAAALAFDISVQSEHAQLIFGFSIEDVPSNALGIKLALAGFTMNTFPLAGPWIESNCGPVLSREDAIRLCVYCETSRLHENFATALRYDDLSSRSRWNAVPDTVDADCNCRCGNSTSESPLFRTDTVNGFMKPAPFEHQPQWPVVDVRLLNKALYEIPNNYFSGAIGGIPPRISLTLPGDG